MNVTDSSQFSQILFKHKHDLFPVFSVAYVISRSLFLIAYIFYFLKNEQNIKHLTFSQNESYLYEIILKHFRCSLSCFGNTEFKTMNKDNHASAYLMFCCCSRWLSFRLDIVVAGSIFTLLKLILFILLTK